MYDSTCFFDTYTHSQTIAPVPVCSGGHCKTPRPGGLKEGTFDLAVLEPLPGEAPRAGPQTPPDAVQSILWVSPHRGPSLVTHGLPLPASSRPRQPPEAPSPRTHWGTGLQRVGFEGTRFSPQRPRSRERTRPPRTASSRLRAPAPSVCSRSVTYVLGYFLSPAPGSGLAIWSDVEEEAGSLRLSFSSSLIQAFKASRWFCPTAEGSLVFPLPSHSKYFSNLFGYLFTFLK